MCDIRAIRRIESMAKDMAKFTSYQFGNQAALAIQTKVRGYLARKKRTYTREHWNNGRAQAFASLLKREKTYVMNLATVVSQYIMPLNVTTDRALKSISGDLKVIFSNIEHILSVHHTFLDQLGELGDAQWPLLTGLGDLFVDISPHWRAYGVYIHNFQVSRDLLFENINNCERFNQFLDERTMKLNTDLNMLLSLPLNHIGGYELILKKLLAETEEGTKEHSSILQALILTEETSNFIANALGKATNVANIERVKRSVFDLPPAILLEVSRPSSQYVCEASVEYSIPGVKKVNQGALVVFQKLALLLTSHGNRGMGFRHQFILGETTLMASDTYPCGFRLLKIDEERPAYDNVVEGSQFEVIMDSLVKRDSLFNEIKGLISRNQRTRSKFRTS